MSQQIYSYPKKMKFSIIPPSPSSKLSGAIRVNYVGRRVSAWQFRGGIVHNRRPSHKSWRMIAASSLLHPPSEFPAVFLIYDKSATVREGGSPGELVAFRDCRPFDGSPLPVGRPLSSPDRDESVRALNQKRLPWLINVVKIYTQRCRDV